MSFNRNQAIVELYTQGKTRREIKNILKVGSDKLERVIKEYVRNGFVMEEKKRGRKPIVNNPTLLNFVTLRTISNRRITAEQIAKEWNHQNYNTFFPISPSTVNRARKVLEFKFLPPKSRQKLTDAQIENRERFAFSLLQSEIDFQSIIFSDESRICKGPDNRYIWYKRGETDDSCYAEYEKASWGVMVWAAIGVGYKSKLMICRKSVNSHEYRRVIHESEMVKELNESKGSGQWIYMQDGATPHTCQQTMLFLKKQMNVLANWPANSPDLNPIEHMWAILKKRIDTSCVKNVQELVSLLEEEWEKIDQMLIDHLVLSFKKRLLSVLVKEGKQLGHMTFSRITEQSLQAKIPIKHIESVEIIHKYDPSIVISEDYTKREFTIEEDKRLLELYMIHGSKWSNIAKIMQQRTNTELRNRFIQLRGRIGKESGPKQKINSEIASEISDSQIEMEATGFENLPEPVAPDVFMFDMN